MPTCLEDLQKHHCLDHYDNVDNSWEYVFNNEIKSIPIKLLNKKHTNLHAPPIC